ATSGSRQGGWPGPLVGHHSAKPGSLPMPVELSSANASIGSASSMEQTMLEMFPESWPHAIGNFTFVDLFAGIGGFRIGLSRVGGKCVYTSEIDRFARQTYEANFGPVEGGDIREVEADAIPDHDVLAAGFPCQPFSIAGVSKRVSLGREHGFRDVRSGNLFFE